jgi:cyclophilin family peptidyl-prolyl cis-trans isomerase
VPSDKRARQRAGTLARREALAQRQKRRRQVRSSITVAIVAVVVVGSVFLITRHHNSSNTPTLPPGEQGKLDAIAIKAGCPSSPKTRVNTLSFKAPPPLTISSTATYTATVKTDVGSFVVALDTKDYPVAANNFVFLARHKFYNCVIFHRVVKNFIDQGGDPTGTGTGGPGYEFTAPAPPPATPQYPLGAVVYANSDNPGSANPKSNGSQFFIVTGPEGESLPAYYAPFGQVTSGMSVVQKINQAGSAATSQAGTPTLYHRVLSVTIKES